MKNLPKIKKLEKLADQFGTPVDSYTFIGSGIRFAYKVGDGLSYKDYSDADQGIADEIQRLQNFLNVKI